MHKSCIIAVRGYRLPTRLINIEANSIKIHFLKGEISRLALSEELRSHTATPHLAIALGQPKNQDPLEREFGQFSVASAEENTVQDPRQQFRYYPVDWSHCTIVATI